MNTADVSNVQQVGNNDSLANHGMVMVKSVHPFPNMGDTAMTPHTGHERELRKGKIIKRGVRSVPTVAKREGETMQTETAQDKIGSVRPSWTDFLGVYVAGETMPYEDAKQYVRKKNIHTKEQWEAHASSPRRHSLIPEHPDSAYAEHGWEGWDDFLYPYMQTIVSEGGNRTDYGARSPVHKKVLGLTSEEQAHVRNDTARVLIYGCPGSINGKSGLTVRMVVYSGGYGYDTRMPDAECDPKVIASLDPLPRDEW